jgi:glutathione synthase/RimK-type ligase-like ATP-grasp enzyme
MTVLILGGQQDPQAVRVREELHAAGGSVMHYDTTAFPESELLSLEGDELRLGRKIVPVTQSVYVRGLACHPLSPRFHEDLHDRPRGLIAQCDENRALLESVLLAFEGRGVRVVNPVGVNEQHSRKPYQLGLLQSAGLPVPRWLATNDPQAVRTFVRRVGRTVYKPLSGGASVHEITAEDLSDERLEALSLAPVLFQKLVRGVSVRAYVVGRRVVGAAEICSPELDYRRNEESVVPTTLRAEERDAVVAAARACSMPFTGVDLIRGRSGFSVLECNPSPMFAVFEQKTGLNIAKPLADFLLRR